MKNLFKLLSDFNYRVWEDMSLTEPKWDGFKIYWMPKKCMKTQCKDQSTPSRKKDTKLNLSYQVLDQFCNQHWYAGKNDALST